MSHPADRCEWKGVALDNNIKPPYCNECVVPPRARVEPSQPTKPEHPNPFDELYAVFRKFDADPDNPRGEHGWNMDRVLMHAHSEIGEVWDALRKDKSRGEVVREVADVMNLAIIIAVRLRVSPEELLATCKQKLADRQRRDGQGFNP